MFPIKGQLNLIRFACCWLFETPTLWHIKLRGCDCSRNYANMKEPKSPSLLESWMGHVNSYVTLAGWFGLQKNVYCIKVELANCSKSCESNSMFWVKVSLLICLWVASMQITHIIAVLGIGQPLVCTNATCLNAEKFTLIRRDSKFTDWQRVRMQENSHEIPAGSLPRTLDIILRHEIVETARAGDK